MKNKQPNLKKSKLLEASKLTKDVKGQFQNGLRAVKGIDKGKINVKAPRSITGSIDIDNATMQRYPQDNRWDYAIEYHDETFFVEIHPASTSEVDTIIAKLLWLRTWLKKRSTRN